MRRKHARFRTKEEIVAVFSPPSQPRIAKLCQIVNISKGGLAFNYIARTKETRGSANLAIFRYGENSALIESLSCNVIYDVPLEGKSPDNFPMARRCGVRFETMSDEQADMVETLIQDCKLG